MGAMFNSWRGQFSSVGLTGNAPLAFATYDGLGSTNVIKSTGDVLPRLGNTKNLSNIQPQQRNFEMAAATPDLFDLTYYSIDPRYHRYYWNSRATSSSGALNGIESIWDIGSTKDDYNVNGVGGAPDFGARELIEHSLTVYGQDYEPIVRDWKHLLNSWHQEGVVTFGLDSERFGACPDPVKNKDYPTPGDCIRGGRVGYSVKMISRDFLESSDYQLGGAGASGSLLNAPSTNGF